MDNKYKKTTSRLSDDNDNDDDYFDCLLFKNAQEGNPRNYFFFFIMPLNMFDLFLFYRQCIIFVCFIMDVG